MLLRRPSEMSTDDLLFGEQNLCAGTCNAHKPTDVDALVAQGRAATETFRTSKLKGWKSDYSKAYKQVPNDPFQVFLFIICQWCPAEMKVAYYVAFSQLFGGKSTPLNFSRYPAWGCEILSTAWAVPASH